VLLVEQITPVGFNFASMVKTQFVLQVLATRIEDPVSRVSRIVFFASLKVNLHATAHRISDRLR